MKNELHVVVYLFSYYGCVKGKKLQGGVLKTIPNSYSIKIFKILKTIIFINFCPLKKFQNIIIFSIITDASVGKSDHISQKHVPDSSSSDRVSVRSGESTKSKDDFKSTKSEKSTRTQEDGIHQKTSSRSGSASRSQQRTPRDSDHEVSGKASKGSRPRDGGNLEHEGSDFGGSDGESRDRSSRKKPGPSTTSSHSERSRTQKRVESDQSEDLELGDFGSDEGFDSSRHNPCSSECSFRRLKGLYLLNKFV